MVPRLRSVLGAAMFALLISPVTAQQGTAVLQGSVADQSQAPLPGATVTAVNTETGISRSAPTDDLGRYRFAAMPTGLYKITAELSGFATVTHTDIRLLVGAEVSLDFTLGVSALQESVTVAAEAPLIERGKSHVATTIDEKQINEMPLISRNFLTLAALVPGAGRATSLVATQPLQIGGADARANYTTIIDGGDVDDDIWGAPVQTFTQDSIKEFQVITNRFDAEYGKALEAVVNVVSKSGTNAMSGSAYLFQRDDAFRSKSYQEKSLNAAKPPFEQRRSGGTIGGPLIRNRTHYFGAYEYVDVGQQTAVTIPASSILSSENGIFPSGNTRHLTSLRGDHQLTTKHKLMARGLYEKYDAETGFGGTTAYTAGRTNGRTSTSFLAQDTWVVSDSTVNDLRFQYRRTKVTNTPYSTDPTEIRPAGTIGSSYFLQQEDRDRYQFYDTLYYNAGSHSIKTGGEITFMTTQYCACGGQNGRFTFATDNPFNAAVSSTWPTRYEQGINLGGLPLSDTYFGMFVQDDWRISNSLTLNLGIRWDVDMRVRDGETRRLAFQQERNRPLLAIVSEDPGLDLDNIDPRFGFAWAPRQSWVLRGGYGIYHSRARMFMQALDADALLTSSFQAVVTDPQRLRLYPDINAILGGTPEQFASTGLRSLGNLVPDDFEIPYAHQVTLGFSHQLSGSSALNVDGVYSATRHQISKRIANLPATYSATNRAGTATNPWPIPGFGQISFQTSLDQVNYAALQVGYNKRLSQRVQGQLAYTYSKALQDGPNTNAYVPSLGRGAVDRGPTLGDMRHKLSLSTITNLPWDFNLSAIVVANSGAPYRIIAGADLDGDGSQTEDRPAGLAMNQGGRAYQPNLDIINEFRRTRGLSEVTLDQLGTRYPYFSVDLRLTKAVPIRGNVRLELLAEVFNAFNRTNFGTPNGTLTSTAFLTVATAADPREAQFGVRLRF